MWMGECFLLCEQACEMVWNGSMAYNLQGDGRLSVTSKGFDALDLAIPTKIAVFLEVRVVARDDIRSCMLALHHMI